MELCRKHSLEATIELRQHVWKRNGIVVWVGAGTIFPKFSALALADVSMAIGKGTDVAMDVAQVFAIEDEPDGFGEKGILGEFFNGDFHLEKAFRISLIRVRAVSGSRSQMRYLRAQ